VPKSRDITPILTVYAQSPYVNSNTGDGAVLGQTSFYNSAILLTSHSSHC